MGRRFLILDTTTYRKDTRYPPGHGYGRNVGTAQRPIWVRGRAAIVSRVIVHATHGRPGSTDAAEAAYLRDSPDVSAHYLIGRAGAIFLICDEAEQAWHSGDCTPDSFENTSSIGIELHAATTEPITAAQKAALADLLLRLEHQYGIGAPDVRSHRAVATPRGRKSDPATWPDAELNVWVATLFATALQPDPLPLYTEHSPILAPATGTLDAYRAAWLHRCGGGPHYADAAIREIAGGYWTLCSAVGVDPWLAAAQCCHETGNLRSWWCARPRRNSCGFGVTGVSVSRAEYERNPAKHPDSAWTWSDDGQTRLQGVSFASWLDLNGNRGSISAHVGRLLAYAVLPAYQTPNQAALVAYALGLRALPTSYWGSAPTLKGLEGKWAYPGVGYGAKIAEIANAIIAHPIAEKSDS